MNRLVIFACVFGFSVTAAAGRPFERTRSLSQRPSSSASIPDSVRRIEMTSAFAARLLKLVQRPDAQIASKDASRTVYEEMGPPFLANLAITKFEGPLSDVSDIGVLPGVTITGQERDGARMIVSTRVVRPDGTLLFIRHEFTQMRTGGAIETACVRTEPHGTSTREPSHGFYLIDAAGERVKELTPSEAWNLVRERL